MDLSNKPLLKFLKNVNEENVLLKIRKEVTSNPNSNNKTQPNPS